MSEILAASPVAQAALARLNSEPLKVQMLRPADSSSKAAAR